MVRVFVKPATNAEAGVPDPAEQASAVAAAVEATGRSTGAGAAAEDVLGSAREAPGVGSGTVGAQVPQDIMVDRGVILSGPLRTPDFDGDVRRIVREELRDVLRQGFGRPVESPLEDDDHDLEITSRIDKFMRGGIAHPARPTPRRSRDFTPEQLRVIEAEPNLFVRRIDRT